MTLKELQMSQMTASPRMIVHLVHGTWPYGRRGKERWERLKHSQPPWFVEGSSFRQDVERHAGRSIEFVKFEWCGENSFTARHEAARDLHEHLVKWLDNNPDACHAVVAHSHGGTVALEAIANPDRRLPRPLVGLLTMGTPFVALRQRVGESGEQIARTVAFRWGLAMMVCVGLALAGALAIGGPGWLGSTVALLIGIVFLLVLATGATGIQWNSPHGTQGLSALLAPSSPELRCPLIAFRVPGDEASLAISAAQFADWIFSRIVWGAIILRPISYCSKIVERLGVELSVVAAWTVPSLIAFIYDWLFAGALQPLWVYLLAYPVCAAVCILLLGLILVMVVPMILLPGMLFLRAATGPEALRYAGYATIDAEPLPAGIASTLEFLALSNDEQSTMALRHSLHELPIMRKRIGLWLRQLCTTQAG